MNAKAIVNAVINVLVSTIHALIRVWGNAVPVPNANRNDIWLCASVRMELPVMHWCPVDRHVASQWLGTADQLHRSWRSLKVERGTEREINQN